MKQKDIYYVRKADLIQLKDKTVLNSLSQSIYGIDFKEQQKKNSEDLDSTFNTFIEDQREYSKALNTLPYKDEKWRELNKRFGRSLHAINNTQKRFNLYNQFLVEEIFDNHFTITLTEHLKSMLGWEERDVILNTLKDMKIKYGEGYHVLGCGF